MELKEILASPELFASKALKVLNKDGELVNLDWNPVQKLVFPKLSNKTLILKARQMGITTMVQGEIFRRLITKTTRALSLSKDDDGTTYLREMNQRFYKHLPTPKPLRKYDNAKVTTFPELESSHFIGTAGSADVGRGSTFNFIHGTEVAFWKDAEKIIAGALQAGNPQVVLESTANGAQGYFYELCMDALAGRNDWNLIFVPYIEFPEYQVPGWLEMKQRELKDKFSQEYPENIIEAFLVSNTGFFSDIQIDYGAPLNPEVTSHNYTGGLDFGQSNDFTCLIVTDRTTRQMVDKLHLNKMSWNLQRIAIKQIYNKWHLAGLRAEKNSIGSVNIEELQKDGVVIESFNTDNSSKARIFQQLHEELETGLQLQNWDILRSEMNSLTSKQTHTGLWTVSASGNNHDDCPMALALSVTAKLNNVQKSRVWYPDSINIGESI